MNKSVEKNDDDWFAKALRAHTARHAEVPCGSISTAWRPVPARHRIIALQRIREMVRNICRAHGLPSSCRVDLANLSQAGAGAAGFDGAPDSFDRPYILLDKAGYESGAAGQDIVDVYCGIGLHEAGHIQHTREFFKRGPKATSQRRMFENLLEDDRIEALVRDDSPGFAAYIEAAKEALLVDSEFGRALANWDALPDLDKVTALIVAFIRTPQLINDDIKRWTEIDGECVFDTLRKDLPIAPVTEGDVARMALLLEDLYNRIRAHYPRGVSDSKSMEAGEASPDTTTGESERTERLEKQQLADQEDDAEEEVEGHRSGPVPAPGDNSTAPGSESTGRSSAEPIVKNDDADRDFGNSRDGRRFGLADADRLVERNSKVTAPLTKDEADELCVLERECAVLADSWTGEFERATIITHPSADLISRQKYAAAKKIVQPHVEVLRRLFNLKSGKRQQTLRGRKLGCLDRRRLGHAPLTDRIFRQLSTRPARSLAICLLLDESGSMQECKTVGAVQSETKASQAIQVAVLLAESVLDTDIDLEVYSHTSRGVDCLVRYLYGQRNPGQSAIGHYGSGFENYDHQAILTAASLFESNTHATERIMLVVTDGAPSGYRYGGHDALQRTKAAVDSVRKLGTNVLAVAIEDYASAQIYGERNVLAFSNLARLVSDMRSLMTQIVKKHI